MELEDLIKEIQRNVICRSHCLTDEECYKYSIDCEDCPYKHTPIAQMLPDILKYLEQLQELEREKEVYKKVFKWSCKELGEFVCMGEMGCHRCDSDCATHWHDYFLYKAREENDNSKND